MCSIGAIINCEFELCAKKALSVLPASVGLAFVPNFSLISV